MAGQTLPSSSLAQVGRPEWEVPAHWQEGRASSIRRGSFRVAHPASGEADISVTAFPGDVGGVLANVNRWRAEVALGPVAEADLAAMLVFSQVDGRAAWWVDLKGPERRTLAATVEVEGTSGFFKMTGPSELLEGERGSFRSFVESTRFP